MRTVAVYNMKGGVGKTTAAVNLSYLAAAAGQRALLWDLDPQAASSFAFRVRPRVAGFGRKSLEDGEALDAAIKETDYHNLDLLPADFAYRKFDRLLDRSRQAGTPGERPSSTRSAVTTTSCSSTARRLLTADRGRPSPPPMRCSCRPSRPSLAADARATDQVGRSFRLASGAGGVLQHGRSPQGTASARLRVVWTPRVFLSGQSPTRASSNRWPSGACRSRRSRHGLRHDRVRRDLGRAPDAPAAAREKRAREHRDRRRRMLRAIESLIIEVRVPADGQEPGAPDQAPAVVLGDRRSVRRRAAMSRSQDQRRL